MIRHVTEAAHLLKTSIVHVEQDAIAFDDQEEDEQLLRAAEAGEFDTAMDDSLGPPSQPLATNASTESSAPKKPVISLSAEEYQKIVGQIIIEIKKAERESGELGLHRSRVIDWYLELKEPEIETEDQINFHRKLIKSVLNRLIRKDSVLIEIQDRTRMNEEADSTLDPEILDNDPLLMIHPNYADE